MEIINRTPFVPLLFQSQDVDGDDFHVFVLKGTFRLIPGWPLRPVPRQEPLIMADQYIDDPLCSSVRVESDIVPLKQNSEITVESTAYAPGGIPASSWLVEVSVGKIKKTLRVTGPRFWYHSFLRGWCLSDPDPVLEVPIRYENAYGGRFTYKDQQFICEENPAGKGFCVPTLLDTRKQYDAPQIESPENPVTRIDRSYVPEGFGPIAKHWLPRRRLCGTADEAWLKQRWPRLPEDFVTDYFNGAPYELIHKGFFRGNETVALAGMDPMKRLTFSLPDYRVALDVTDVDKYKINVAMHLDTVSVDVPNRMASLVWRGTFLKQAVLEHVEVRLLEGMTHGR